MRQTALESAAEFEAMKNLEYSANDYSWDENKFAASMSAVHRTIQQRLLKSFLACIREMGKEDYGVDDRNRASHELCKKIIATGVLNESPLPFI